MSYVLKLKDRGAVPPGGEWRYRDPDTGQRLAHPYYQILRARAHDYRLKSSLPIPFDWEERFDTILCQELPIACVEVPGVPSEGPPSVMEMAKTFAASALRWALSGFKVVAFSDFQRRMAQCAGTPTNPRCSFYQPTGGFGTSRCGKCGCTAIKQWLATEKCPLGKW